MTRMSGVSSSKERCMEKKLFNSEDVGTGEIQKLWSCRRKLPGSHYEEWFTERISWQAWSLWMVRGAAGSCVLWAH